MTKNGEPKSDKKLFNVIRSIVYKVIKTIFYTSNNEVSVKRKISVYPSSPHEGGIDFYGVKMF